MQTDQGEEERDRSRQELLEQLFPEPNLKLLWLGTPVFALLIGVCGTILGITVGVQPELPEPCLGEHLRVSCPLGILHRLFPPIPVEYFIPLFVGIAFTLAAHTLAIPRPDPRDALSPQKASDAFRLRGGLCLVLYLATIGGCSDLFFGMAFEEGLDAMPAPTRLFLAIIAIITCVTVIHASSRDRRSEDEKIGSLPKPEEVESLRRESEARSRQTRRFWHGGPEVRWHLGTAWTTILSLALLQFALAGIVGWAIPVDLRIALAYAALSVLACGAFLYFHHSAATLKGTRDPVDRITRFLLNLFKWVLSLPILGFLLALPFLSTPMMLAVILLPPLLVLVLALVPMPGVPARAQAVLAPSRHIALRAEERRHRAKLEYLDRVVRLRRLCEEPEPEEAREARTRRGSISSLVEKLRRAVVPSKRARARRPEPTTVGPRASRPRD